MKPRAIDVCRRLGAVAGAAACGACGGELAVPLPDLSGVERMVEEKVLSARDAVRAEPSAATWGRYARTLHAHDMLDEAETAYLAAAAAETGPSAFDHLHLAGCAAAALHPDRAADHLRRAIALRDDYEPTHLRLAGLLEGRGQRAAAGDSYRRALAVQPSSHAWLGLGRLALAAGDAQKALEHFRAALALDPRHRQVHEAAARAYARLGRHDESREAARRAGDLSIPTFHHDPLMERVMAEDVSYRRHEGFALALLDAAGPDTEVRGSRDRRMLEQALIAIDQACRARPDYPPAHHYRGMILARLGDSAAAIAEFERVLRARADDADAHLCLADVLQRVGRRADARRHLDAVLSANPQHEDALAARAAAFLADGDQDSAEADLRALLDLDPDNAWARARLRR